MTRNNNYFGLNENEKYLINTYFILYKKILKKDFVIDKSGVSIVEIIANKMIFNPSLPVFNLHNRNTPIKYCKKEHEWYLSQSLSVDNSPVSGIKIWEDVKSSTGMVNSNYGWCIFSRENGNQYQSVYNTLLGHSDSRQAVMIYNRPSIHTDFKKDGMSDFICTLGHQFFIRDNKLYSIVNMRSNDAWIGFYSDMYWFMWVHNYLLANLKDVYKDLENGSLIHIANSFHIYERHFDKLKELINFY